MIKIKRVYESFDKNDGFRILVDRLWPRGLTKGRAKAGTVTLLFGTRKKKYNNAVALKEFLE